MHYNFRKYSAGLLLLLSVLSCPTSDGRVALPRRSNHGRVGRVLVKNRQSAEAKIPETNIASEKQWTKTNDLRGQGLIDFFDFETENTSSQGGLVQYISAAEGFQQNLLQVQEDAVYFRVDQAEQVHGLRKAIRISSKTFLSPGNLLVIDVKHMPAACGAWPAIWTVAKDGSWPAKGELDLVEGVNLFTQNAMSAHTRDGFVMQPHGFTSKFMLDSDKKNHCGVGASDNQGCGLRDTQANSFGEPFNAAGGGLFVLDWQQQAIWMNFFPRDSIPDQLRNGAPAASAPWRSNPRAYYTDVAGQPTGDYFKEHALVINTNLCGKWPEGVWSSDTSYAGQGKTCAAITGKDNCADFLLNSGSKLAEAYWAINSIQIYKNSTSTLI